MKEEKEEEEKLTLPSCDLQETAARMWRNEIQERDTGKQQRVSPDVPAMKGLVTQMLGVLSARSLQ